MATLPPGVSSADFSTALGQFAEAVGPDWVFSSDEDVALYRDAYSPFWGEEQELMASAAVSPTRVEEVQEVVRIANQYQIPLYPISTGKNLGYGGSAPSYSGSVVVDLKRMNRVLEINERNASCLVEPGVSYFDLYRAIQDQGAKLWIDCPDPGWGSPIGNSLDHGLGYTMAQYRDHFDAHCGMEVVLANGEVLRTGMGALPGSKTWQEYKYGFGPHIDGMFSQSNFGIVTKMGFWLAPEPEAFLHCQTKVYKYEDLIPLMDTVCHLANSGIMTGRGTFGSPLTRNSAKDPALEELLSKPGGPDPRMLERYAAENDVPYWTTDLRFYGLEKANEIHAEYAREKFSAIPGAKFEEGPKYRFPLTPEQQKIADHIVDFGIPNMTVFSGMAMQFRTSDNPNFGDLFFAAVIPKNGEAVFEAQRVFTEVASEFDLPLRFFSSLPSTWFPRATVMLFSVPVSRNVEMNKKSRAAYQRLVQVSEEHGWGEYRTAPAFQDMVMNAYSFNNNVLRRFHETVKDAIDPNGILSPGKSGIWPKRLRDA